MTAGSLSPFSATRPWDDLPFTRGAGEFILQTLCYWQLYRSDCVQIVWIKELFKNIKKFKIESLPESDWGKQVSSASQGFWGFKRNRSQASMHTPQI